ncbi:MAG: threonylcarbamoyl-AMP synthase [Lachnospiraceae bacterium]|nr:threonylcarbamoyl-AMP synthase [Lachnospiraceae bacterium]
MNTRLLKADEEAILEAGELLRKGELVAFPTETVYGLGGDAFCAASSKKIYAAKGRPSDNPLIVHIAELSAAERLSPELPESFYTLAEAFWPGPLTMIVNKRPELPGETTGGLDTVAIRLPDHPVALAMIKAGGGYIAAPSANASGRPSPTLAEHVMEDLNGRIPLILDGGEVGIGVESTIVDLSEGKPMILRPGYITAEMLERVLKQPVGTDPALLRPGEGGRPKAPGMRYRHYAPKGSMQLVEGSSEAVVREICRRLSESGKRCGVLCTDETKESYRADAVISLGSRSDLSSVALSLYRALRELDDAGIEEIYSESFETEGFGMAVMNRMLKAAGYSVVKV